MLINPNEIYCQNEYVNNVFNIVSSPFEILQSNKNVNNNPKIVNVINLIDNWENKFVFTSLINCGYDDNNISAIINNTL